MPHRVQARSARDPDLVLPQGPVPPHLRPARPTHPVRSPRLCAERGRGRSNTGRRPWSLKGTAARGCRGPARWTGSRPGRQEGAVVRAVGGHPAPLPGPSCLHTRQGAGPSWTLVRATGTLRGSSLPAPLGRSSETRPTTGHTVLLNEGGEARLLPQAHSPTRGAQRASPRPGATKPAGLTLCSAFFFFFEVNSLTLRILV